MHPEARDFTLFVKSILPHYFEGVKALDCGSGDINGNNRFLFDDSSQYTGNDIAPHANVDIVCKTHELPFEDCAFDTIVSTECLEHDQYYALSLQKICKLVRPGGLFLFTCASTGRPEHGTRRTTPQDSLTSLAELDGWSDYYGNLTRQDVEKAIDCEAIFHRYAFYYNRITKDLYFVGVKKGGDAPDADIATYSSHGVTRV